MIQSNVIWASQEVAETLSVDMPSSWSATGVSIDSRDVKKGDLFIALISDNGDGHDYAIEAINKGAVAAIVSREIKGVDSSKLVVVDDTFEALKCLGRAARNRCGAKIIAFTSCLAESSTKELLQLSFSAFGQVHVSEKSYGNVWGLPLSMARMHAGADYGIFEIEISHSGHLSAYSEMISPDICIVSKIMPNSLENGLSANAVKKLFTSMREGSKVILESENIFYKDFYNVAKENDLKIFKYGEDEASDSYMNNVINAANGSLIKASVLGQEISFSLQVSGNDNAVTSLGALTAIRICGESLDKATNAFKNPKIAPDKDKYEFLDVGDNANPVTLINESNNGSTKSMQAAFKVLALIDPGRGGRRIAVLGDMLALDKDTNQIHNDLSLPLKAANVDLVYTCGKRMEKLYDNLPANQKGAHRESSRELAQIVPDVLIPGDVVMVKGSLGSKMSLVVEALRALPLKFKKATEGNY